jgi:hypothetical protein
MMRRITIFLLLTTLLLLISGNVGAMSSDNYRLDWSTQMTGGGGPTGSANYAVNLTVGQSVIGASSSASYASGLGYWYGAVTQYRIYLPLLQRNGL